MNKNKAVKNEEIVTMTKMKMMTIKIFIETDPPKSRKRNIQLKNHVQDLLLSLNNENKANKNKTIPQKRKKIRRIRRPRRVKKKRLKTLE